MVTGAFFCAFDKLLRSCIFFMLSVNWIMDYLAFAFCRQIHHNGIVAFSVLLRFYFYLFIIYLSSYAFFSSKRKPRLIIYCEWFWNQIEPTLGMEGINTMASDTPESSAKRCTFTWISNMPEHIPWIYLPLFSCVLIVSTKFRESLSFCWLQRSPGSTIKMNMCFLGKPKTEVRTRKTKVQQKQTKLIFY